MARVNFISYVHQLWYILCYLTISNIYTAKFGFSTIFHALVIQAWREQTDGQTDCNA